MSVSFYQKFGKRFLDIFLAIIGLIFFWPILAIIAIAVKFSSPGPVIFLQKRVGLNGKIFTIYKFRTMVKNAEGLKAVYRKMNEADGPVFKIKNDPRYTPLGKKLSHSGLDELPQLINILKGEMSLVGPRPLPIDEESQIDPKTRKIRRLVRPGLTCSWLLKGAHRLTFNEWMKCDLEDINKTSPSYDLTVFSKTIMLGFKLIFRELIRKNHFPFG